MGCVLRGCAFSLNGLTLQSGGVSWGRVCYQRGQECDLCPRGKCMTCIALDCPAFCTALLGLATVRSQWIHQG